MPSKGAYWEGSARARVTEAERSLEMARIELKRQEIQRVQMATHPVEFDMYYSV